jgi:hypothetical protein
LEILLRTSPAEGFLTVKSCWELLKVEQKRETWTFIPAGACLHALEPPLLLHAWSDLMTMSQPLDQTLANAQHQKPQFGSSLEALLDLELEARSQRSSERRFRLSRLQAKHAVCSDLIKKDPNSY